MTIEPVLVDGHVHLHPCYEIDAALDAAVSNFDRARSALGMSPGTADVLWVVENLYEKSSERLLAQNGHGRRWQLIDSNGVCLSLSRPDNGRGVMVILGRQVRTAEDLEVLIVGTLDSIEDRRPLEEIIELGLKQEALVMLPWGFGKWTGSRGMAVTRAYRRYASDGLLLADTGLRTKGLKTPVVFSQSVADGRPILAGSDPFPFPDQAGTIGKTGFVLDNVPASPNWKDLLNAVATVNGQPRRFGNPLKSMEFARLQWTIQMRKRFGRGTDR